MSARLKGVQRTTARELGVLIPANAVVFGLVPGLQGAAFSAINFAYTVLSIWAEGDKDKPEEAADKEKVETKEIEIIDQI